MRGALTRGAVLEVAVADSFQGACFLQGHANVAGDGQRLGVTLAGLLGGRGPGRKLAEAVQRLGLAEPAPEIAVEFEGLLEAGGSGRVVPGQLLHEAELVEGDGLSELDAEVAEHLQSLPLAGGSGRIVPGFLLHDADVVEGCGLAEPVADLAEYCQRLLLGGRGGQVVSGPLLHLAQMVEGFSLGEPAARTAG